MKKILLVSLLLITVLLAACSEETPQGPQLNPWVGGQEALQLELVPGMPPSEEGAILDNDKSSFSIGVKVTNAGEYDILPSTNNDFLGARVRGILPSQFNVVQADLEKTITDPLQGAKKNMDGSVTGGQFTTATFNDLRYQPDSQGDVPKKFVVDVCYDYQNKATVPVCIAQDVTNAITSDQAGEICDISGSKNAKNSGGPIQVTEFKQQPQGGNKISVIFTISHLGNGKIYEYQSSQVNACDDSLSGISQQDNVLVDVSLPPQSSSTIDCAGQFTNAGSTSRGTVKLFDGNPRSVTCSIEETSGQQNLVYEDLLDIAMSYRYQESLRKSVVIKDAGN